MSSGSPRSILEVPKDCVAVVELWKDLVTGSVAKERKYLFSHRNMGIGHDRSCIEGRLHQP